LDLDGAEKYHELGVHFSVCFFRWIGGYLRIDPCLRMPLYMRNYSTSYSFPLLMVAKLFEFFKLETEKKKSNGVTVVIFKLTRAYLYELQTAFVIIQRDVWMMYYCTMFPPLS
jgi:hypothetical protein